MKALEGKAAVVTGASRGIGAAIARRLAAAGAQVVVNFHRSVEAADQVVAEIEAEGGQAFPVQADMADLAQIRDLFAATMARCGRLDILVNNAGAARFRPLEEIDARDYEGQFAINVRGVLFATQEAARLMGEGGRIINISSGAATAAPPGTSVYSATKAAVETFTRVHAVELGPRQITVNAIAPGLIQTDMLEVVIPAEALEAMIAGTPLRRLGTPEEIASAVAFLASEEARFITGQVLAVSGGFR